MAEGKRPVPFRTRKLSPPAPMVLHSRGCGRVGHRRTSSNVEGHPNGMALDVFTPRDAAADDPSKDVRVNAPDDRRGRSEDDDRSRQSRGRDDRDRGGSGRGGSGYGRDGSDAGRGGTRYSRGSDESRGGSGYGRGGQDD